MAEAQFKPVASGYVFQTYPWLLGPSRRYLVNEEQKAAIIERLQDFRLGWWFWLIFVAVLAAFGNALPTNTYVVAAIGIGGTYFGRQVNWRRALRPILSGLPQTQERITFQERQLYIAAATPTERLLLQNGIVWSVMASLAFFFSPNIGLWPIVALFALAIYRTGCDVYFWLLKRTTGRNAR